MRALACLATVALALVGTVTSADAAGRRPSRHAAVQIYGLPHGGYHRSVPLTPMGAWITAGPPRGGYYRTGSAWVSIVPPWAYGVVDPSLY